MWKVGLIGIIAAFISMILKKDRQEYAVLVMIGGALLIFVYTLVKIEYAVNFIRGIMNKMPVSNLYFIQLIKMLGITYMAEFASNICKDSGHQTIAGQVELFAKVSIVILSIPCITLFFEVLEKFL